MTETNYKKTIWLSFFGLVLFLLFTPVLFGSASFSETINYQGKLMDDTGDLVADGSYNMRFRLCADDACASVLYDESWIDSDKVEVTNGLFSVLIGSVSSTLGLVDFNQDIYLEVSVGGTGVPSWETLTPRKRLGAVPNAFNSKKFDGLTTSSIAVLDRENTFTKPNTWNLDSGSAIISIATTSFSGFSFPVISGRFMGVSDALGTNDIFVIRDSADNNDAHLYFANYDGTARSYLNWTDNDTYARFVLGSDSYKNNLFIDGVTAGVELGGSGSVNAALFSVDQASGSKIVTLSDETNGYMGYFTADGNTNFVGIGDFGNNYSLHVYSPDNYPAIFETSVGIGTTSPIAKLSVAGDTYLGGNLTATGTLNVWGNTTLANLTSSNATTTNLAITGLSNTLLAVNGLGQVVATTTIEGGSGTVTSVAMTVPTGLAISGSPITTSGTLALSLEDGYNIPLTASTTNWNTAYSWGNHALAGYLTSYTESDPLFMTASTSLAYLSASNIFTGTNIFNATTTFNGRVGIGTTDPSSSALYVVGTSTFDGDFIVTGSTTLSGLNSGLLWSNSGLLSAVSTSTLGINESQWTTTGTAIYYNDGSVGIGTTTPGAYSEKFGVYGSGQFLQRLQVDYAGQSYPLVVNNSNSLGSAVIAVGESTASGFVIYDNNTDNFSIQSGEGASGGLSFISWNGPITFGLDSEVMRIASDGKIGIGTAAPAYGLDVWQDLNVADSYKLRYNGQIVVQASTTRDNYFFGGAGNLTTTGSNNSGFGKDSVMSLANEAVGNSAFGSQSLKDNTEGDLNNAYGFQSLLSNTTGYHNVGYGASTLYYNSIGNWNTAVGNFSLYWNRASNNTALGANSLYYNVNGSDNVALGMDALYYNATSSSNVAVGFQAGYGSSGANNSNNSLFGYRSGYALTTGSNNLLLGYQSGNSITTGSNNIIIGYDIDTPASTTNNHLNIGNLLYGDLSNGYIGIGTSTPQTALHVLGTSTLESAVIGYGSIIGQNDNYITFNNLNIDGSLVPYQTTYAYDVLSTSTIKFLNNFEQGITIVDDLDDGLSSLFTIVNNYSTSTNTHNLNFTELIGGEASTTNFIFNGNLSVAGSVLTGNGLEIENGLSFSGSLQKMADNLELPHKLRNLYIADDYAYTISYATNSVDSFRIIDISNPSHPRIVGGAGLTGLPLSDGKRVWASGNYAYLLYNASGGITNPFRIVDISDKSNPVVVSGEDLELSGLGGSAGQPFYVSGKYAYVLGTESMHVVDISDPYSPRLVSSLSDVGYSNWDIKVVGDYAYVCARKVIGGQANPLTIVNVKDKTNPFIVKEVIIPDLATSTNLCWSLDVAGANVYLGMGSIGANSSTESFRIVDVSNPNSPVVKGGRDIGTNSDPDLALSENYTAFNYVKVLGNRLYATTWMNDFLIIDVSSSTNPSIISKTRIQNGATNTGSLTFDFRGNYVAVGYAPVLAEYTTSTDYFRIYKLPGADIWGGHSDAFSAGSLQVLNNAVFNQRLTVWDSLEVGSGGIYSQGSISVTAIDTPSYFGGSIGIGTTTPAYKLSVYASSTSDYLLQVATSTNLGIFEIRNDGIGRFGGDLIVGGNSTTTGNMVISGTGTSTIAGNLQIAQGKVLQVETIIAYSPLNINTGMIVSGNVTTTGNLVVSGSSTINGIFGVNTGDVSNFKTSEFAIDLSSLIEGAYFNFPMLEGTIEDEASVGLFPEHVLGVRDYLLLADISNSGQAGIVFSSNDFLSGSASLLADFTSSTIMSSSNFSQNINDYEESTYWDLGLESVPWNNLWLQGNASILTLNSNGAVYSNNGILTNVNPSSMSYKHDIASTTLNIDALLGLQVKSFTWNNNGQADFGLIAEEIKAALPELYVEDGTTKGYRADHLPFYLLQIAQRQKEEIDNLKNNLIVSELTHNIESLPVGEASTFQGTITVIGEAGFRSKVTFSDHVYFAQDAAGTEIIPVGATSTEVKFSKAYEVTPIITVTPKKKLSGIDWWVESETPEGFVIAIDPVLDQEIQFNWHAVAIKGSGLESSSPSEESNIEISPEPEEVIDPDPAPIVFTESPVENNEQQTVSTTEPEQNAEEESNITEQSESVEQSNPPVTETISPPDSSGDVVDQSPVVTESEAP